LTDVLLPHGPVSFSVPSVLATNKSGDAHKGKVESLLGLTNKNEFEK